MVVRILLADDEPAVSQILTTFLQRSIDDFEVISALNGKEAIAKAQDLLNQGNRPDITLIDLLMPVMDGIECTSQLIELGIDEVYVLTAHVDPDLIAKAEAAGAKGIIKKSEGYEAIAKRLVGMIRSRLPTSDIMD
ncbi:MAG: response regulator [Candidatus Thorarchaeota archaeon]|nr:MAG: response regulator [Candidatus Thorarchaeota archaeon]